tara:strand:- start:62149 stop:62655 length:507 start_codon:yes stop_codon:yes gene_type:complete
MKSFKSYLVENEQTYKFRLKIAEMLDDERMDALESALEKYEVASISKPKKTPIQEHPMDFQTLNNAEVFIMDAELKYPVTANSLYEYITQVVGVPASHLVVINSDHPEEIAREEAIKEQDAEYISKLEDPDYKDAKDVKASDSFGDEYNGNMLKGLETRKYEFEAKGK